MPRVYRVSFENVAVSGGTNDLVQISFATQPKIARVRRLYCGATDTTLPTSQLMSTRFRILPATFTTGSGGASATPAPADLGDPAATFSAQVNNTTKATTSGTAVICHEGSWHIYNGEDHTFPEKYQPTIVRLDGAVYELLSTVSGTVHLSGWIEVEEFGG